MYTKFWSENLKGRDHSKDQGIDGMIILQCVLGNGVWRCGLDSSGSGQGPVTDSCEHGDEPSGSIKGREISW